MKDKATESRSLAATRLMGDVGPIGWLVPIGLILVLGSNIVALFLPFMEIGIPFKREVYSIPHGIYMMWEFGYYYLAALIFLFSLLFPLVKTISLIIIWFLRVKPGFRNKFIRVLESLGKWSFLDIFVVVLLMVLSNDQVFVDTEPKGGLLFFIVAIIGNMLMSRLVEMIDSRVHQRRMKEALQSQEGHEAEAPSVDTVGTAEEKVEPLTSTGPLGWFVPLLMVLSFGSILVAVEVPFLRINDALLHSYSYSVSQAAVALFEQGHITLGIFTVLFVGVAPALNILLITWMWFSHRTVQQTQTRLEFVRIIGEWSMMSVFLLALVLTISEGKNMIRTDMLGGAYAIAASLAICSISIFLARWLVHRKLKVQTESNSAS